MFKPRYEEDFDLMVAKSMTQQCLLKCFPQTTETQLKTSLKQIGDFGDLAVQLRQRLGTGKPNRNLELGDVIEAMSAINEIEGEDSTEAKIQYICSKLLS